MPFTQHTISARNLLKAGLFSLALMASNWLPLTAGAQAPQQGPKAAQTPQQGPKTELSDAVAGQAQEIVKMIVGDQTAKPPTQPNFNAALNAINALLAKVPPDSYDTFYLSQMKVQAILQNNSDPVTAARPLETMLSLMQRYPNFDRADKSVQKMVLQLLSQIYLIDAGNEKNLEMQKQKYARALTMLRQWIAITPNPPSDAYVNIASILYQQATASGDPKTYDKNLLKQAEADTMNALTTTIHPRDNVYMLMVAIAQAQGDSIKSSEYLEVLVANNPKNAQYWGQLLTAYINTTEETPADSFLRNEAYAKAIYTLKRAQQNGFMQTPKDNYNMAALYVQSGQVEGAVDILEPGLRNGKIDASTYNNWELLSSLYQQLNNIPKAIETYKEAIKHFPNDGNIDMQIGQLYFNMTQYKPALESLLAATKKEVAPRKLPSLYTYIAYVYLYLKEYDLGMTAINKALELSPTSQEAKGIKSLLAEAIAQRDSALGINREPAPVPAQSGTATPTGTAATPQPAH